MKVLVTGCSGRFGPYVLRELAAAGHELVIFGRRPPEGEAGRWPFAAGDVTAFDDCRRALETPVDAVLHLAAQPWPTDHPRQQPRRQAAGLPVNHTIHVNVTGTYNVLHAAMLAGVKRFVMTGSNCALGHIFRVSGREFPCRYLPLDEDHPADVEDSYSFSKLTDERLCEMYSRAYGMRAVVLRCAGLCDEAARKAMAEKAKPADKWDWGLWTWVAREDAAAAHRLVLENLERLPPFAAFFCNADDTFALEESRQLLEKLRPDLGKLVRGDLEGHASFISNQRLRRAVGWEPRVGWRQFLPGGGGG